MAKKLTKQIKLQIPAAKANPAPPVGTALGPTGINIQDFCKQFNDATKDKGNTIIPVVVSIYEDRSFDFIMKVAPASELIKKSAGVAKGSGKPLSEKIGSITNDQLRDIAIKKMTDLNTDNVEQAMKIIAGTARQMGIEIKNS